MIFFIPSVVVPQQDHLGSEEDYKETNKVNKAYTELCQKKVSSDAFIERGS